MRTITYFFSALLVVLASFQSVYATDYFVTVTGAGNNSGDSWENALDRDGLVSLFDGATLADGDNVYIGAGTYTTKGSSTGNGDPAKMLYCTTATNIYGGYPAAGKMGTDISIEYPTADETIFSGNLQGKATPDNTCSSTVLYYYTNNAMPEIKGISFVDCLHGGVNRFKAYNPANTLSNANSCGALVLERTSATLQWCQIYNNTTPPATDGSNGANYQGGALNITGCALVHIKDCIFRNNYAARLGGAIAIKTSSTVVVERCLFDQNCLTKEFHGRFGGSIAANGTANCYIVNSTFARAKYYSNGGALSGDANAVFNIISSTFAENDDYGYTTGSYGYNMRGNNGTTYRLANTININNRVDKNGWDYNADDAYYNRVCGIYCENVSVANIPSKMFFSYSLMGVSGVKNVHDYATYSGTGNKTEVFYEDIFDKTYDINNISSTSLADNGGFSMTMAPVVATYIGTGMPQSEYAELKTLWNIPDNIWNLIDLSVDQRGYIRSEMETSIGAYDEKAIHPDNFGSSYSKAKIDNDINIKNIGTGKYVFENLDNATVTIYNVAGSVILQKNNVKDNDIIDLASYASGVYLIKADTKTFKVSK